MNKGLTLDSEGNTRALPLSGEPIFDWQSATGLSVENTYVALFTYTIPESGSYFVTSSVTWSNGRSSGSSVSWIELMIYKNTSQLTNNAQQIIAYSGHAYATSTTARKVDFVKGDILYLKTRTSASGIVSVYRRYVTLWRVG